MSTAKPISEATAIAEEAYIFGFPLVLMDVTRGVSTSVSKAGTTKAPINQLCHLRAFPDYTFTDVVSPNADTLYSTAWLDLTAEPLILSVPDVGKRYYLMPMLDAWTNVFASPGLRTTGSAKGSFAVTGPGWSGKLPSGVKEIKSPTNMVWMIGRTQTNGKEDFAAVHAIQDQFKLTPLSAWRSAYTPPENVPVAADVDGKTPPAEQVAKMDAATFFRRLNSLMKQNPPAAADTPAIARFATVGIAPGKPFDLNGLDTPVRHGVNQSVSLAQSRITGEARKPQGRRINNWDYIQHLGAYGTSYLRRAVVALVGLGANLPEDAIYPHTAEDSNGQPLRGAHRYLIRFPRGQMPPANAFWSLTMYNADQAFNQNPIGRYAIGDRDELKFAHDGSLTIYLQRDSPGEDKESNWLPAPANSFNIIMRLYWPRKEALSGAWKLPPVERVG